MSTSGEAALLQLIDVTRRFPGVVALERVSFDLLSGEVHALVGENGAGKSTLIHLVSGVLPPDEGTILIDGRPAGLTDPVTARRKGVVTVHQEAETFGTLDVAENMALGYGLPVGALGLVRWGQVYREASRTVAALGEPIDVRRAASTLSVAHRHMTQVATAVLRRARVVILDEPTSSLTAQESRWLFDQIARLKQSGVGIIYISHRQEEIFALADRITVLRDGRRVWSGRRDEIDRAGLIEAMVGRERTSSAAARTSTANVHNRPVRLEVRGLGDARGRYRDVNLSVRRGEVVGIYGLVGAGRTEFARALFGLEPAARGMIAIDGQIRRIRSAADAVRAGIAYVPEDRLREGLLRGLSVRANTVLSSLRRWARGGFVSQRTEEEVTQRQLARFGVRHRSSDQRIVELSGGNQQKVVLARWLLTEPSVLILDEPTRGVDVGAKAEIHRLLREVTDAGCAVMMISSELPEVMENSDRIVVFRSGTVAGEFDPAVATPTDITGAALPLSAAEGSEAARESVRRATRSWRPRSEFALLAAMVLLAVLLASTTEQFLSTNNLLGILTGAAVWTILALAASAVIAAGGIDISIGALVALSAAAGGLVLKWDAPPALAISAGIATGLAVGAAGGLLNAAVALVGRVHPIVVTLGTMTVYRGLLVTLTGGQAIADLPSGFGAIATMRLAGVSGSVLVMALAIASAYVWLAHTRSGRHLYAYGASPSAARLVGITQRRTWLTAFGGGGLLAGLAGMLELSQNGSMQSVMGTGYELRAIAAAVIGGTAITGGRGSVGGVVLGAWLLALLYNALVLWQVSRYHYDLVIGGLILVAVLLDLAWRRLER